MTTPPRRPQAAADAQIVELALGRRAVWRQGDFIRTAEDVPAVVRRPLRFWDGAVLLIDLIGGRCAGTSRLVPADSVRRAPAPYSQQFAPLERRSLSPATYEIVRELRYCSNPLGGMRMEGQIGRAQEAALVKGWLIPDLQRPGWLLITKAGRTHLVAARAMP